MKHRKSFRLSEEACEILEGQSRRYGLPQTAIVEIALRFFDDAKEAYVWQERGGNGRQGFLGEALI